MNSLEQQIAELERKLQTLDAERDALSQALTQLKYQRYEQQQNFAQRITAATVTQQSLSQDKIKLF